MKTIRNIMLTAIFTCLTIFTNAQDDFYPSSKNKNSTVIGTNDVEEEILPEDNYSTANDYYIESRQREREEAYNREMGITDSTTYYEDENGNVRITNNYFNGDNYDFDNEYYDYEYAARIRRFRRGVGTYGYYDDYYTNYYWYDYDPYFYGTSIYTSYNWWNPRPWRWNVGWSYWGGWNVGWNWGWGWTGNFGYCGVGYYGWNWYYNPYYWNGGFNGYYANNHYYNSYDRNSYYYGKRGSRSGYSGYGRGSRTSTSGGYATTNKPVKTFGQKYESAVKTPVRTNTGVKPTKNSYSNGTVRNNTSKPNYTKSQVGYNNPRTTTKNPTNSSGGKYGTTRGGNTPKTYTKPSYTKPSNSYGTPKKTYNNGSRKTYNKPSNSYNKPSNKRPSKSYSKPSYNKPSYKGGSSRPSYNRSSGSFNRSGGTRSGSSRSGGRRR